MLSRADIAVRLADVRERIGHAAGRAHRAPGGVRLVLASKTQPPEAIEAAYAAGAREFGENYVQEALAKRAGLGHLGDLRWHLIGHLQTNKAAVAAGVFSLIHSLDSARLAAALARAALDAPVPVLIEVNLAGEPSKTGVAPDALEQLIVLARGQVAIEGLMAVPPAGSTAEDSRPYFARLRTLRDALAMRTGLALRELSMGMSEDFEVAIEEGATIVRLGRVVFGERL